MVIQENDKSIEFKKDENNEKNSELEISSDKKLESNFNNTKSIENNQHFSKVHSNSNDKETKIKPITTLKTI